ncbi:hypothetical protein [Paracoccus chinensis]|uniref:Uncharacterized protein n=1 Tax=Paracoccus chinensis TaxID=525640 RepID=A0A1G9I180_9RHOB|nr:hypothetical protein [Paracoccus chinensis]SDL18998.1 hypothetical protein SAMN04487971_107107 [Paracoccus chinensis]
MSYRRNIKTGLKVARLVIRNRKTVALAVTTLAGLAAKGAVALAKGARR